MEPDTDPEYAIDQINSFLSKIGNLQQMDCENPDGESEKTQLEIEIRGFLRTYFKDDDKKLQDLKDDRSSNILKYWFNSDNPVERQREYEKDLEIIKNHLIVYKTELESINNSRRKAMLSTHPKPITKKTSAKPSIVKKQISKEKSLDNRKVFIVHGHDSTLKREVELYLRTLFLKPIILHQQASRNKTIIEKVEYYSDVSFAVILLTPDDIGAEAGIGCNDEYSSYARAVEPSWIKEICLKFQDYLKDDGIILSEDDNQQTIVEIRDLFCELKMRSRQNVLFECGYFISKLGRENVAILCDPVIEIPTDLHGLCYLKIEEYSSWKKDLAKEIDAAGIKIDKQCLDTYDKMKSYLMEEGFKSLNITYKTSLKDAYNMPRSNFQKFSLDFIDDMKNVGFIDSNDKLTDCGRVFIDAALGDYIVKDSQRQ